jgi:hypothetical protein
VSFLTAKQVKTASGNFLKAADVLLTGELPGQAIARAHYAIHCISDHCARNVPNLWPKSRSDPNQPADRFYHMEVPNLVWQIMEHRARRRATKTDPHWAKAVASQLLMQRMEADYKGYKDISKALGERLVSEAKGLASELLDEIEHIVPKRPK